MRRGGGGESEVHHGQSGGSFLLVIVPKETGPKMDWSRSDQWSLDNRQTLTDAGVVSTSP